MDLQRIEKQLGWLRIYGLILTVAFIACFAWLFYLIKHPRYAEIDVERLNVVENNGKLRMVLSNQARQHPGRMDGVTFDDRKGQRPPGLMFFGENENEIGGLVFDGNEGKGQGGSLTFDKFRGDQTIQIIHEEDKDQKYFAGIKMNDQNMPLTELLKQQNEIAQLPSKEARELAYQELRDRGLLTAERLRIGRDYDQSAVIRLKDAKGKVRIEMKVEADGDARIDFLDRNGAVTYTLPEKLRPK